jgi:hypothetical protein
MIKNFDLNLLSYSHTFILVLMTNNIEILDRIHEIRPNEIITNTLLEILVEGLIDKIISIKFLNRVICINKINITKYTYVKICNFIINDPLSIFENSFSINRNNYNYIIKIIKQYHNFDYNLYNKVIMLLTCRSNTTLKFFDNYLIMYISSFCT